MPESELRARWGAALRAEEVRLPVTRDTWVSSVGREQVGSNGGASPTGGPGV